MRKPGAGGSPLFAGSRPERGCPFGSHRAGGGLPQPAERLDVSLPIWSNELLLHARLLNLDSSSMRQIAEACGGDETRIAERIREVVTTRGKMHNPVTGSGGVLVGEVVAVGPEFPDQTLRAGDPICSMVSLSLVPLVIEAIHAVHREACQVEVSGYGVLFERGLFARVPDDIPLAVATSLFDVAGAPGTVVKMATPGQTVCVLGSGRAGLLSLVAAREAVGPGGTVIAADLSPVALEAARVLGVVDHVLALDLRDALAAWRAIGEATGGAMADLVVNTTNVGGTEGASILAAREQGRVLFFSMATSFTTAALAAEGMGRDVQMIIGNGYTHGWVETTLRLYRAHPVLARVLAAAH